MGSSLTDEEYPKAGLFGGKVGGLPKVQPASGVERLLGARIFVPAVRSAAQVEVRAARFATVGIPTSLSCGHRRCRRSCLLRKAGSSVWPPDGRAGHVRGTLRP